MLVNFWVLCPEEQSILYTLEFSYGKDHEAIYCLVPSFVSSKKWESFFYWDHDQHWHKWALTQKPYKHGVKLLWTLKLLLQFCYYDRSQCSRNISFSPLKIQVWNWYASHKFTNFHYNSNIHLFSKVSELNIKRLFLWGPILKELNLKNMFWRAEMSYKDLHRKTFTKIFQWGPMPSKLPQEIQHSIMPLNTDCIMVSMIRGWE